MTVLDKPRFLADDAEDPRSSASTEIDLAVEGLGKSFLGKGVVFGDVSFSIERGQSVALIGSNGTGKSTLMRCCLRLIEPDRGTVKLFGQPLAGLGHRALRGLRSQIGFVFQRHNLVPRLTALTNVIHGSQARSKGPGTWSQALAGKATREEAMACLDRVGLADLAGRRVDQLSGGQSQRVAIARALMQRPRMVFADEPVASLDPNAGEEVMELFVELLKTENVSLFHTSHHLSHAVGYSDRVIGLRGGGVAIDAPASTLDVEELREIYE